MAKDQKKVDQFKQELTELLIKIGSDKKLLNDFLADLLTPAEFREIATRLQIVKQLKRGALQREVVDSLHAGMATVTRGSRTLLNPNGGFNQVLRKYYAS